MTHTAPAAERAILGAVLLSPTSLDTATEAGLSPEDFADPANAAIYGAMTTLSSEGKVIDVITLAGLLQDRKQLDTVGGVPYLSGLSGAVASLSAFPDYVATVQSKALTRGVQHALAGVGEAVQAGDVSGEQALERAESAIQELRATAGTDSSGEEIGPIAERVYDELQRREREGGGTPGLSSGFGLIDKMLGGFRPGHLDLIAGRPGSGKTSLAFNIAAELAIRQGCHVVAFSLEMPREQLVERVLCAEARVKLGRVRDAKIGHDDWGPLLRATEIVQGAALYIDDKPAQTVAGLRAVIRRRSMVRPVDLVLIDYVQLMRGTSDDRRQGRQVEVSGISAALKALAKDFRVPVLALAQLNRKCEERTDKRPLLSDLRESGALEQDADSVSFLYRDEVYSPDSVENKGLAEFIVRKNRHGETGTIPLAWRGEFTRFENLERDRDPAQDRDEPDVPRHWNETG